jgi:hypothetical protein
MNDEKKRGRKLITRIGICLIGVILSFVVLAICIQVNVSFAAQKEAGLERLERMVWRTEYIFFPIVVTVVSLVVSVLDRTRYKLFLVLIALLPIIVFQLSANLFSLHGWLFSIVYLVIASAIALLIPGRQSKS